MPVGGITCGTHSERCDIAIIGSFSGAARFAHWHMDAANRDELVSYIRSRTRSCCWAPSPPSVRSDDAVLDLGGSLADLYPKRSIIVATQDRSDDLRVFTRSRRLAGFATPLFIIIIAALNGVAMGFDMPARQHSQWR